MKKQVIKRDGRIVKFDKFKIVDAVFSAFKAVDGEISEYAEAKAGNIADYIEEIAEKSEKPLTIEEIQDYVEKGLQSTKRKDVAKAFILYREDRNKERAKKSVLIKEVGEKISASNIQNSNANMDEKSFGGRKGAAADTLMKDYALNYCMSEMSRNNHLNNEIYIHDLDNYALGNHNCLTIPFDNLLANGFNTRQVDIRPANSLNTAFQLIAVIFQLQSLQQFGGCSASHLDWTMVPYVRKSFYKHYKDGIKYIDDQLVDVELNETTPIDKYPICKATKYAMDMTIKECQQACEGLYHNLNSLQSRSGNQLPFTSVNFDTCTLPEGRMVIKAMLEGSLKGVGKFHRTSIFPCVIWQYHKDINGKPGTPNYDLFRLALKCTAHRLYPNYVNCEWSNNTGVNPDDPRTYASTMGCRTWNGEDINGLGAQKDGRGNICPVTIILPTLAMMAKERTNQLPAYKVLDNNNEGKIEENIRQFMFLLDKKIHEAKDMLIERYNYICSQDPASAKFMYENNVIAGYDGKTIESAMKHGTLAIGQIALAECLQILIGEDHTTKKGMELAKRIEQLFKDRCKEFKEKYHLNFGVYFTPAEGLSYTALKNFRKQYGIIPNVSDKDFFTNSMHVPVWKELTPIEKIDIESQLTGYSSAGCITYVELAGSVKNNLDALETLVTYAMEKDIPYFAINIPIDTCMDCGYTDELGNTCPECNGTNIQRLRRVTGYLTGDYETAFNLGKQAEVKMRYKHQRFD